MYKVPSSERLREFLKAHNLTGATAAGLVGVEPRTVRRWTAYESAANRQPVPYSAWTLLRLYVGEISVDQYRVEVLLEAGNGS